MCGFAGFLDPMARTEGRARAICRAMSDRLAHRGPDGDDVWVDAEAGVGLGHRRLSIIDLSPAGLQPMRSASGRFRIAYNGEVYNAAELRDELETHGRRLRGQSDTEVLLEAIDAWGLVPTLERTVGMFAFALWDARERRLHLVRDRIGIKPLYYGWIGTTFLFGSELKALKEHPSWVGEINRDAVALQMQHSNVPAPWCVYQGFYKLMPGCVLSIQGGIDSRSGFSPLPVPQAERTQVQPVSWWDAMSVFRRGLENPFLGGAEEAQEEIEGLLGLAVRQRLVSDVPLGAFLSGGIDSSVIVSLMQQESSKPVRTFSMGMDSDQFDEAPFAAEVARHLETDHT